MSTPRKYVVPAVALLIVVGAACAVWVWPTQWRYDRRYESIVRINRFTDEAQVLSTKGWQTFAPDPLPLSHKGRAALALMLEGKSPGDNVERELTAQDLETIGRLAHEGLFQPKKGQAATSSQASKVWARVQGGRP
ncbi:MAG TPA: hypothetical protein VFF65_12810 [Phycisphaerales bacterium]|nr:hypothetical protein [Phycisphaerales bacterium]